jgi:hypothetical protein
LVFFAQAACITIGQELRTEVDEAHRPTNLGKFNGDRANLAVARVTAETSPARPAQTTIIQVRSPLYFIELKFHLTPIPHICLKHALVLSIALRTPKLRVDNMLRGLVVAWLELAPLGSASASRALRMVLPRRNT